MPDISYIARETSLALAMDQKEIRGFQLSKPCYILRLDRVIQYSLDFVQDAMKIEDPVKSSRALRVFFGFEARENQAMRRDFRPGMVNPAGYADVARAKIAAVLILEEMGRDTDGIPY